MIDFNVSSRTKIIKSADDTVEAKAMHKNRFNK